jgi:hypothetical protein
MKDKSIRVIFWVMVAVFLITIGAMFLGALLAGNSPLIYIFLPFITIFFILGVILLVLTMKKKVGGITKKFLILTGAAAVGLPVFAVLHNLVSDLLFHFFGENFWGAEEPVFFVLATIVCPLGFLAGAIGTIILAIKEKRANSLFEEAGL